ncbi:Uncharacterized protein TCM_036067 [Theobroma cacao]|uniref:Reverse transcriptase Ty1/copia-type domain-containing protein n=1 Tax=Theobroma cacao TaxID=3641 RepID=A0A061FIR8_THECC|nr:Uncharacterized protein TCM_036067 [Theobroma cacao]
MDVKTTLFNGELEEEVYMKQVEGFSSSDGEQMCVHAQDILIWIETSLPSMDDVLLATNIKRLLYEVKQFLSKNFDMKDMDEASYVFGIKIYKDRSPSILVAIFSTKNNKSGNRSKHIDIKYLAVKEHVKENKVVIEHVSTKLMIVDPLTKGMLPMKFKNHVA